MVTVWPDVPPCVLDESESELGPRTIIASRWRTLTPTFCAPCGGKAATGAKRTYCKYSLQNGFVKFKKGPDSLKARFLLAEMALINAAQRALGELVKNTSSLYMASFVLLAGVAASPASAGVVNVTPSSLNGWSFSNQDNAPNTNASGGFEVGPSVPPLGTGSAQLLVNDANSSEILSQVFASSVAVGSFSNLSYSTFVTTSTPGSGSAPNLEFDLFQGSTYAGRLVFDPGLLGTVVDNTWQSWNATGSADAWYLSKSSSMFSGNCFLNNGNYCTFAQASALLDGDNIVAVDNLFKAGSHQASFNGNVDAYTINSTTYNFDPAAVAVPEPLTLSLFAAGLVGAGALRRRKKAKEV
jgi:hypothetical protein